MINELLGKGLIVSIAKNKVDYVTLTLMIWEEQDELKITEYTNDEVIREFLERIANETEIQWILSLREKYYSLEKVVKKSDKKTDTLF